MARRQYNQPYVHAITPARIFLRHSGLYPKGYQGTRAENYTPEQNARRFAGLIKVWKIKDRDRKRRKEGGEAYMKAEAKRIRKPRIVLRTTIAREAREIQDLARKHADQAMTRMAEIINDPNSPDNIAVAAAEVIFNRAYGKPNQLNTNLNVDANGKPKDVSGSELDQRIKEALNRVEDITRRAPKAPAGKKQPADLRKLDRNTHGPDEPVH